MAVTIKDVAKKANVSISTVSRVLSNSPKISEQTKRHVRKVIKELGYHANLTARSLVQQTTRTIGIVMKNSSREALHTTFLPEVLGGITAITSKYEFSIRLAIGESEEEIFQDVTKMVQGKQVDGVIVLYSKKDDPVINYLKDSQIPFVILGRPTKDINKITFVDNDNRQAAMDATNYIIQLGHKRIAYIGDDTKFEVAKLRITGFRQAILDNGLKLQENFIKYINGNYEEGFEAVRELMSLPNRPTAIVLSDDINALIVLSALSNLAIKIPEDVSIISFNNSTIARITYPRLTTVDVQVYQLGQEAAKAIIEQVNEPNVIKKSLLIPTVIIERESCKKLTTVNEI
ncbi:LacI family DNA-binding transcriptional regulator [Bacillus andreraoultii]|uniref:LacI family DNA-binding transcriptional regulator n=1 Tax=Bacillus andreraoultii TaxID=1499685 RepID=UPI000539B9AD|nr:LacI family DNA-binding transcriptional regulator [Bacillus andreraoultii]